MWLSSLLACSLSKVRGVGENEQLFAPIIGAYVLLTVQILQQAAATALRVVGEVSI